MSARTIHPFPARMAPDIAIDHLKGDTASGSLAVLDPMCGSGTVLAAATANGHSAQGFDVDPLAVLMSKVATQHVDTLVMLEEAERAVSLAERSRTKSLPWSDGETVKFAEYWFGQSQRTQLHRLSRVINTVADVSVRQALQIALSRTIVTKSPRASLAADTSHSRPHRVMLESSYDVFAGFTKSVKELKRLLDQREVRGTALVGQGDARSLRLENESVDLVITSPPYLNAIDYLRGHKLSLIWLGYSIPELRKIRSNSIGAERALGEPSTERVEAMVDAIKQSVPNPGLLPIATITRYARDLCLFGNELRRVSKPGARVITVIGNSTLRGNYIQNDSLVCLAYKDSGFRVIDQAERALPENRRYLPVSSANPTSSMAKRMRKEVVLTVECPKVR
ncbi:hypothetical protein [Streptomyces turgidiscabies]|uniref:hypothetical protein n=1 Tax=Streptomyces turgidiscabies TaxID=85558 RepID=UPI0038F76847